MSLIRLSPPSVAVSLALLTVAGCGGAATERAAPAPEASASPTTRAPSSAPLPTPSSARSPTPSPSAVALGISGGFPTAAQPDKTFEITFAEGRARGDTGRLDVALGDTVTVRVTSLRADQVHLHGYDLTASVGAGRSGVLTFAARVPGVFLLELEDSDVTLGSVHVS